MTSAKTALYDIDSGEQLGFVSEANGSWVAETIFNYTVARTDTKEAAERTLMQNGKSYLGGVWEYVDASGNWHHCKLKEVFPDRVVVIRTDQRGVERPGLYKQLTIKSPDETTLTKSL